jgi:hypothetical protein
VKDVLTKRRNLMSEAMARAVGAAGARTVEIAGKECRVRPLGIRELTEAERECLASYRRSYIKTFVDSADMFPEGMQRAERARDEAARWDIDDLPPKAAYDGRSLNVTKQLKDFLKTELDPDGKLDDDRARRLATGLLDQGTLTEERVEQLTGKKPRRATIPYVNWWITGCFDGMVTFVWLCFRPDGVTKDQVAEELGRNPALLVELSREIEGLSAPEAGNG